MEVLSGLVTAMIGLPEQGRLTYRSTLCAENTQEGLGSVSQIWVTFPSEQRGRSVGMGVIAGLVAFSTVVGIPCSPRYDCHSAVHFDEPMVHSGDGSRYVALSDVVYVLVDVSASM